MLFEGSFCNTPCIECSKCVIRGLQDCLEEMVHGGIASYSAQLQCLHFCQIEETFQHFFPVNSEKVWNFNTVCQNYHQIKAYLRKIFRWWIPRHCFTKAAQQNNAPPTHTHQNMWTTLILFHTFFCWSALCFCFSSFFFSLLLCNKNKADYEKLRDWITISQCFFNLIFLG